MGDEEKQKQGNKTSKNKGRRNVEMEITKMKTGNTKSNATKKRDKMHGK